MLSKEQAVRKLSAFATNLSYIPQTLRLIWSAAPYWTGSWLILLLVQGILPAASVYLTRLLVDNLVAAIGGGTAWTNIQATVSAALLMVLVLILTQTLQSIQEYIRVGQAERIQDYLTALVHERAVAADLAYYENPAYHNRLFQASYDLRTRPLNLLESIGSLLQNGITLVAIGALLAPYGLWVPALLVISTVPALGVVLHFDRLFHQWWERTTEDRRWADYYNGMLTLETVAGEIRLFNLGGYFKNAFQTIRLRLRTERLIIMRRQGYAKLGAGIFAAFMTGLALIWMALQAFQGLVTLGDVALFYQALNKGQGLLRTVLNNAGQIYNNTRFLGNLFEFFSITPEICDPEQPVSAPSTLTHGIHFKNVTFRYPGSREPVFVDFDFFVPAGKVVALVGENGAGKSTFAKLICRLYDPESGSIELDGVDIRELRVQDLRSLITGMFQQPVSYFSTVSQSIAMGDLSDTYTQEDVELAARSAGAHDFVMRLPKGYDTLLGKLFPEGTQLSGGELQRLALARSFYREAPIMILDEPTSFMDSWSEIDWFDRFRALADGRTAILITHHFITARRADLICVMDQGHIIETGTHEELLARNGKYAESWTAQTQLQQGGQNLNGIPATAYTAREDVY